MAYVRFCNFGYEYFDEGFNLLFSENNSHELLFQYVTQDLSCLSELFEEYVSRRIGISTFKLHDCLGDDTYIDQIKNTLMAAHPYYKHEATKVLIRAIGNYFNSLLLYSCYHQHIVAPDFSREWYMDRIKALLAPLLTLGDTYPEKFYGDYQEVTARNGYTGGHSSFEIETAIYGVPREKPTGFGNEIRKQSEIYNMLYFLLDISAQGLNELTTPHRIWFYNNIMATTGAEMTVPRRFSFERPILYQTGSDDIQIVEYNCEQDDRFRPLYALSKSNIGRDGIPTGLENDFRSAIECAKSVAAAPLYETYCISNLRQLLYLEVWSMVQSQTKIRKCRNCGKYFVAATRRIVYCDRMDQSGMSCSAIGYQQSFQKKLEDDEPLQIYNRAYKTHHARMKKGIMSKVAFQQWCDKAKQKLAEARAGELDIANFQEWLKK